MMARSHAQGLDLANGAHSQLVYSTAQYSSAEPGCSAPATNGAVYTRPQTDTDLQLCLDVLSLL
jgi:hypothetical protein